MAEFLTKAHLKALKSHSYKSVGRSLMEEHILRHFWDFVLQYLPMSWAPNSMTLTGVVAMLIPFVFIIQASPDASRTDVPSWVLFATALALFVFQTLDNLDGRQARRTNSCNCLGEFFDHGCDTISDACMIISFLIAVRFGTHPNLLFTIGLTVPFFDYSFFWRAHWTGEYVFGDIDISEIQWVLMVVITMSGITDSTAALWDTSVLGVTDIRTIFMGIYLVFTLYYLGDVWFGAIKTGLSNYYGKAGEAKCESVMTPGVPMVLTMSIVIATRYLSGVFELYPVAFLIVYGLVGAKLSCRLLVANMTKTSMVYVDSSMLSFGFILLANKAIAPTLLHLSPSAALFVAAVYAGTDLAKYVAGVTTQMADFLGVKILTLGHKTD